MSHSAGQRKVQCMTQKRLTQLQRLPIVGSLALLLAAPLLMAEEPTPAATAGFDSYIGQVESRLSAEHSSPNLYLSPEDSTRLKNGEVIIEQLTPVMGQALPGALLHDWRGTAFVPGGKGADFERVMRNFAGYPHYFSPQVLKAKVLTQHGDDYQVTMRVKQQHILTVIMDTAYDVTFGNGNSEVAGPRRGYSISRSTRIAEIASPGTAEERALSPSEEHGYLWRLNTYWSYEEADGGLYIQIESVSLTRSIPTGLGWAIGPFIESVPKESLEFTLGATRDALTERYSILGNSADQSHGY